MVHRKQQGFDNSFIFDKEINAFVVRISFLQLRALAKVTPSLVTSFHPGLVIAFIWASARLCSLFSNLLTGNVNATAFPQFWLPVNFRFDFKL